MRALSIAATLLLVACTPEEGDRCTESVGRCLNEHEALWCIDGVMTRAPCGGPAGCAGGMLQVRCDQSVGSEGDVCVGDEGGGACSADGASFLRCTGGRLERVSTCRGPAGCHHEGTQVRCDESVALPGDRCTGGGGSACAPDGHAILDCTNDGVFVVRHATDTCVAHGGSLSWTGSHAVEGEACQVEGGNACGEGRMLICRGGAMRTRLVCRGPHACEVVDDVRDCGPDGCSEPHRVVHCDQTVAAEGDTCEGEGAACNEERTERVRCENGHFVRHERCPEGCRPEPPMVYCEHPQPI